LLLASAVGIVLPIALAWSYGLMYGATHLIAFHRAATVSPFLVLTSGARLRRRLTRAL
jgi:hypothetical protein